nr:retrotransposon Gag domain, retroviral aspartyl protease [Tanacetum cinerariifolium]
MDIFTKGALWDCWKLGSDEIEPTNDETFDLEETDHDDEQEIGEIFRIETNLFDYETPMCEKFKEFNYLLKIDTDVLTKDIDGFKTYDKCKDGWIYEWNENVSWVYEKPWTDTRVWTEPVPIVHCCKPFNYKSGYSEWLTCSWKEDGYCNGGNIPGAYIVGNIIHHLVPMPGNQNMVHTQNSDNSNSPDPIATQLAAIAAKLEAFETMKEDIATLKEGERSRSRSRSSRNGEGKSSWRGRQPQRPYNKIDFLIISSGDPRCWLMKAKKYFRYYQIPDEEKVEIASMHLEGDALDLYSWLSHDQTVIFWEELVQAFTRSFGPVEF